VVDKNIYTQYLNTQERWKLTETSPITDFSSSLPGKTQQHPTDPYLLGTLLWPADHQMITTNALERHYRQTSISQITQG